MKIKQTKYIGYLFALLVTAITGLSFVSGPTAHAYTCSSSTFTYNGVGYPLQGGQDGSNCYAMVPDNQDNSKKQAVIVNGQPTGKYECVGGTVMHDDGNCWTYKKVVTNAMPTYDDGTQVPNDVYQNACQQMPTYYGMHWNYDGHGQCQVAGGCSDISQTVVSTQLLMDNNDMCRSIGDGTKTPQDINKGDPTSAKVQECTGANAQFDTKTHQCNWTQQSCPAKNGGQGVWTNNHCSAYSDFTNAQDCQKVGGDFKITKPKDPSNPQSQDTFTCVKPGTNGNQPSPQPTNGPGVPGDPGKFTSCGKAQTNLISCDGSAANCAGNSTPTATTPKTTDPNSKNAGAPVIGCVLRFGIDALTTLIGIAAVGGIAWEAMQYARAQDNESILTNAKNRIRDIVIGLIVYGFMIAIIGWLVPGSVISGG